MSSLMCRAIRMRPSSSGRADPIQAGLTRWPLGCTRRSGAATGSPPAPRRGELEDVHLAGPDPHLDRHARRRPAGARPCGRRAAAPPNPTRGSACAAGRARCGRAARRLLGLAVDDVALGGRLRPARPARRTPSAGTSRRSECSDGLARASLSISNSGDMATSAAGCLTLRPAAARPAPAPGSRPPSRRPARSGRARSPRSRSHW